jgi:outer membrane protein
LQGAWTAVVSLSYPIFDGFRTKAQVAQAQINLQTVQQQKRELERQVNTEILQTVSDLKTSEQKIELEKTKLSQAQRALRIAEERYEKGLMSTTDLIEAQTTLSNSRLSILQLTVNYILNQYTLSKAAGRKIH